MDFHIRIPLLNELNLIVDETAEGKYRICFNSFISFLRKNESPQSDIRKDNIRNVFKKHKGGLLTVDEEEFISYTSLLKFVFQQSDRLQICRNIVSQIETSLLNRDSLSNVPSENVSDLTILDIYKLVSKLDFKQDCVVSTLHGSHKEISDADIPTLYTIHKPFFEDALDWEKIRIFEWHYGLQYSRIGLNIQEEVSRRLQYYTEVDKLTKLRPVLQKTYKERIQINSARKDAADYKHGIQLCGNKIHIPSQVDSTLWDVLTSEFPDQVNQITSTNCQPYTCSHGSGIHVYVELKENANIYTFDDITVTIQSHLLKTHQEHTAEIVYLKGETFNEYGSPIQRFQVHDDWCFGKLKEHVMLSISFQADDDSDSDSVCEHCNNIMYHKYPLDWRQFNTIYEWTYHVPLSVQILFETFINPESVRKTKQQADYVTSKLQRLYGSFDSLLNIYNRCYSGIHQDLTSDELSMSYHSVNTVFSLTSQAGLTCSYAESERRLKKQADPSVLHYRAFIEKQPLDYMSVDGSSHRDVNLNDCHLMLCLDNLVRLTFHQDQKRGDPKSSQLCTLPITIMGLPRDATEIQSWHDERICDGGDTCQCKESVTLRPEDFDAVFLHPTKEEEQQMEFFKKSITWGMTDLWKAFSTFPELAITIDEAIETDTNQDKSETRLDLPMNSIEERQHQVISGDDRKEEEKKQFDIDLNESMTSLHLHDSEQTSMHLDVSSSDDSTTFFDEMWSSDEEGSQNFQSDHEDAFDLSYTFDDDVQKLNDSITSISFDNDKDNKDEESQEIIPDTISTLGFRVYRPPKLLVRHPPPAHGRDDDPKILQDILLNILYKTGNFSDTGSKSKDRILFAPDNKIGKNLLNLMNKNNKLQKYLPEFPLLHLRKSKIVNFSSAYRNAGLDYLFGFMQDQTVDLKNPISVENIESATRHVRRISLSLHLAFNIRFLEYLPSDKSKAVHENFREPKEHETTLFHVLYLAFLQQGCLQNATFAMHYEMMTHCDEILAIAVAERIGGPGGYDLMLAAVKSSLPFSFLNGATSYAAFCCQLLHEHYRAGTFHQNMKKHLFSTPYKGSKFNFALDTQREMDHKEALKGFRPRATLTSVLPRMSLVDVFAEMKKKDTEVSDNQEESEETMRTWKITKSDVNHIVPTALLILREGALNLAQEMTPRNVYDKDKPQISDVALDRNTLHVGEYLVKRYAHLTELCGLPKRVPEANFDFPKELSTKVKRMKEGSFTVRRMTCHIKEQTSEREKKETIRQKRAKHLSNVANALTSDMNTCQAIVKPDTTKAVVNKSAGIRKALSTLFALCYERDIHIPISLQKKHPKANDKVEAKLREQGIMDFGTTQISSVVSQSVKVIVIEFAGVKFKTAGQSGTEYIQSVESTIKKQLKQFENTNHIIICEEKYGFTPDEFKADTRSKRKKNTKPKSVAHLKRGSEIISMETYDKQAACTTSEGKSLVSTFLSANIESLDIKQPLVLDIDSEWIKDQEMDAQGLTKYYAVPTRTHFARNGIQDTVSLSEIHQRKGEAEMSQLDWISDLPSELDDGDSVISLISSADIDSIPIHLFALPRIWPRKEDGSFKFPLHVILQKARGVTDRYNLTKMIEELETRFGKFASMKIAIILCMGGNDFMLKFNGISHEKMLLAFLSNLSFWDKLIIFNESEDGNVSRGHIDKDIFRQFIATLYCPSSIAAADLTFSEIRQLTVKYPGKKTMRKPQQWMPPETALDQISSLVDYQIEYLLTAGCHSADLPNFLEKGCLKKFTDGSIGYHLGPDVYIPNPEKLLNIPDAEIKERLKSARRVVRTKTSKRGAENTPQKGQRRKRKPVTSTPRKSDTLT